MHSLTPTGTVLLAVLLSFEGGFAATSSWSGNGPCGGYIASLAVAPTDPLIVFAGTSAGVYKSVDGGHSWTGPVTGIPLTLVGGIAIDPSDPARVFAAVGELPGDVGSWGVYRSTDSGATWARLLASATEIQNYGYAGLPTAVTVDYRDGKKIYVGNFDGLVLRSSDGGDTWAGASARDPDVTVIEVSRTSGSIYACANSVNRSDDGGRTWTELPMGCFWSLTILPTTPDTILVGDLGGSGIHRSTDAGRTWAPSNDGLPSGPIGLCNKCYQIVSALACDRDNSSLVYAGFYGDGVYTSSDGGKSWLRGPDGVPPDARVMSFAFRPKTALIGTGDGGVYAAGEDTATPSNRGLNASIVHGLALTPSSEILAASNSGLFRSSDGGASWKLALAPNPSTITPGVWSHPTVHGLLFAATFYGGLLRSDDDGQSWDLVVPEGYYWGVSYLSFDPRNPGRIFAGTVSNPDRLDGVVILESADFGSTWTAVKVVSGIGTVLWIGFDDSIVYAHTDAVGLYRSTDSGATWVYVDFTAWPGVCWGAQAVVLNPWGEQRIYTASGEGRVICQSDDSGTTFHRISGDLSAFGLTALVADPSRPGTFFAASEFAPDFFGFNSVLVTSDYGATWSELSVGFPGTEVLTLALDASTSTLYAGTLGSGVISIVPPGRHRKVSPRPDLPLPTPRKRE